jgi:hypothetical protein
MIALIKLICCIVLCALNIHVYMGEASVYQSNLCNQDQIFIAQLGIYTHHKLASFVTIQVIMLHFIDKAPTSEQDLIQE